MFNRRVFYFFISDQSFIVSIIILLASCTFARAQNVRSEVPYYSYGEGIGVSSEDSLFLLNIHLRIQNRFTYTSESKNDLSVDELQARIQRLRLRFDGFFYDPNIIYVVQLAFSEQDIESDRSNVPAMIVDAVIFYRFNKHFMVGLGKTNLPRNRQAVMSSGDLQLIDRSLVNETLGLFRDFGLQTYYYNSIGNFYYALRTAVTAGEGSNEYNSNNGLSYSGRVELLPFGQFENGGDYFEGDLEREETPKFSVGLTYHFSDNTTRTGSTGSNFLYEARDLTTIISDGIFKYRGLSASYEFVHNLSDGNPVTTNEEGERSYVFVGYAQSYQLGYLFKNDYEIVGRYAATAPGQEILSETSGLQDYTLGLIKYIKGHRLKLQSDVTYRLPDEAMPEQQINERWQVRVQIELGF